MFSDPEKNVANFGLMPGMRVADLGSGSGFYSLAAGKIVGEKGRVYAVDVQKDLLAKLKNEAENIYKKNIETIWGNIEKPGGSGLHDNFVDAVFLSNVLFQTPDKAGLVKEARRILKPKGRVLVIDWTSSFENMGPTPENVLTSERAQEIFEEIGFALDRRMPAGAHHYGLIFKKI
ncbi:MAG: methyltransferase domain-containing protein [Candidatus Pacebacteria bacterium]|nr:methyltransferase domain-containing protein [Candidatus Paceibacterota bacterium]